MGLSVEEIASILIANKPEGVPLVVWLKMIGEAVGKSATKEQI